ncbi:unnamed protein product [Phytophthora lilii]|uniref:Unnamed protein product n=1 Tax=Phytophthora lilii TaxID=2077276 RepID=A0A9W6WNI8_9STRA|nr:unnamed protein product [Phytophthora lilii]
MPRIIIVRDISAAQTLARDLTSNDGTVVVVFKKSKYYYHAVGTPRAIVDAHYKVEQAFAKKLIKNFDVVTPRGLIQVNSKLQLDNSRYFNIYALGDSNVTKKFPTVDVVSAMVPLGPSGGVSQLPFFVGVVFGNFVKYFASFAWKDLNAEIPN